MRSIIARTYNHTGFLVATKFQQHFGNQPEDKEIRVQFTSSLGGSVEPALVRFPLIRGIQDRSYGVTPTRKLSLRIPLTRFRFVMEVFFPSANDSVQVNAQVNGANIQGLQIHQEQIDFVQANLVHVKYGRVTTEECTVSCADGTSRSGMGACIDCPGPRGTVRFCC